MRFKGMSRSHLFLIELIVVILFFSSASVITVQVFIKAFQLSERTTALNGAMLTVQTAAETDKTVSFQDIDTSKKTVCFNEDWEAVDPAEATYTITSNVTLDERSAGTMAVYDYTAASGGKTIYQLQAKRYYPGEMRSNASPSEVN